MENRCADMFVLCCTIVSMMLSGCNREDSYCCDQTTEIEFEKSLKFYLGQINNLVELRELSVSESISNANAKAMCRKKIGANYHVIPVYCSISEAECSENLMSNCGRDGFRIEFICLGERVERRDLNNVWLIVVFPSKLDGHCDVVETSLANITHGMGSSLSNFGFGDFWCRCNDPRLGWGSEKLSWNVLVANESCKMYLLLDDGAAWGRRHGRTCPDYSALMSRLERLNEKGVLIELMPVAASKHECVLKCL